jgi:hypothetical protein
MQTLSVGAGRTDKEYKEAEEQRRSYLVLKERYSSFSGCSGIRDAG